VNTATTTWPGPSIVQATIERPTAMRLAETEYQRVTDAVDALQPEDWGPLCCADGRIARRAGRVAGREAAP
jgi:hypothetical protein